MNGHRITFSDKIYVSHMPMTSDWLEFTIMYIARRSPGADDLASLIHSGIGRL